MRSCRIGVLTLFLLLVAPAWAQQAPPPQQGPPASPVRDSQAISVLNQALNVAGGSAAISAIADYTASGNITYHSNPDVQGTVVVRGLGASEFRLDASLSSGLRSWSVDNGLLVAKSEQGRITQMKVASSVPTSDAVAYHTPLFAGSVALPYRQLVTVLNNPHFAVTTTGVIQFQGHSVYDITVRRSGSGDSGKEFFVDSTTFEIFMVSDLPQKFGLQVHYSDFRAVNGVLVPFSISGGPGGSSSWVIQLNQISVNSGLQQSEFALN